MAAYFLLSFASGPIVYITIAGHFGWVLPAFFAWRVSRGGRISRALLMAGAAFACLAAAWAVVFRFTPGELGVLAACAAQLAILVSPAVFWRTRPAGWADRARRPVRPRRPGPRWLVVVLACAAALSLTGTAVTAAAISGRADSYNARTVDVRFGQPATATLTPGRYFLFVRCAYGCPAIILAAGGFPYAGSISPRQLAVQGTSDIVVANISSDGDLQTRGSADWPFQPDLVFTVPATQRVRMSLDKRLRQPAFVAPAEQKSAYLLHWIELAVAFGLLLLASLGALAWTLPWRPVLPLSVRW
jgi:hypothetical protein